jgi:hypothetical protein
VLGRNEAAIDEHNESVVRFERRQNPVAGTVLRRCRDEGFTIIFEASRNTDGLVFVIGGIDRWPRSGAGCCYWSGMHAMLDTIDEVELPRAALHLPNSERREYRDAEEREQYENDEIPWPSRALVFA